MYYLLYRVHHNSKEFTGTVLYFSCCLQYIATFLSSKVLYKKRGYSQNDINLLYSVDKNSTSGNNILMQALHAKPIAILQNTVTL